MRQWYLPAACHAGQMDVPWQHRPWAHCPPALHRRDPGGTLVTWHAAATGELGGRSAPICCHKSGCVPHAGSHTAGERLVHCSTPRQQWHGEDQTPGWTPTLQRHPHGAGEAWGQQGQSWAQDPTLVVPVVRSRAMRGVLDVVTARCPRALDSPQHSQALCLAPAASSFWRIRGSSITQGTKKCH